MVRKDGRPLNVTSYAAIRGNKSISVLLGLVISLQLSTNYGCDRNDGTHLVSIDPEFDYWENQSTLK